MLNALLLSAIVFLVFGIIWTKKTLVNFIVKLLFIGLGIIDLFYWFLESGYVVK